jgi:2-keto-4-pentenoate hydratase/2-oxohepta-3-ene-1,7-dioic acid hydratase in catechol pathway
MRLVTYDREGARRLGAWVENSVVDLPDAVGHPVFPATMEALVARHGGTTLEAARDALAYPDVVGEFSVPRPRLLAPLVPSFNSDRPRILGPGQRFSLPSLSGALGLLPQVACIVGRPGRRLTAREALHVVFGYTLMARWSILEGRRGRAIAIALGPAVVTADELDPRGLEVAARVDGGVRWRGVLPSRPAAIAERLARASATRDLRPGELFAITPGVPSGQSSFLITPPAVVELEATSIGVLRNRISRRSGTASIQG